ncbi:hypothetical protein CEU42_14495 [Salmonella enterica subsp. enterica serovar Ohio]|uniref:Uncharacterized protein n=3 Tax=Salmonella enterica TaxID=28901 RepID=A0A5T3JFW2_SALER|nr:hypothetical protein CHC58_12270 [Salmonella enterica]AXE13014.1 hypothetical protein DOE64_12355 [Salmonella enterica subsp. enterica serovar Ohio]EAR5279913.1 hypothetical protein [Salmonella enterica subsp. enterica serovar Livingstone]EBB4404144.1 hypothetical protein [Salmonella enterica subsp. enterica serovar Typhimurium]EBC8087811.1 hypothetical protein [Salmonella enterica subsp. enterica serovar Infantis]
MRAIGKYIEVWHYPDGLKELRLNDAVLPYSTCDRLQEIVERTAEFAVFPTPCRCRLFSAANTFPHRVSICRLYM